MITDYVQNIKFVDEQLKGPYSYWHHTHTFESSNDGTFINDKVIYALPFGIFGRITHRLFIKRSLNNIFDYRVKVINQMFSGS